MRTLAPRPRIGYFADDSSSESDEGQGTLIPLELAKWCIKSNELPIPTPIPYGMIPSASLRYFKAYGVIGDPKSAVAVVSSNLRGCE